MSNVRRLVLALVILAAGTLLPVAGLAQATIYVATNGSHNTPFNSWGTAATNIQIAINSASPGDTILVTDGVYNVGAEITIASSVTVASVNGPAATIVNRSGGSIRLFYLSHAGAFLTGFTITNGFRPTTVVSGQGAGFLMSAGTVSNCVVTGCDANRGSMVYMTGGLFTHSVVSNNTESGNSGGNGGVYINGGNAVIQSCTLTRNTPGSEDNGIMGLRLNGACTARNCTIVRNRPYSATKASVAVSITGTGSLLQNCLVAENPGRGVFMTGAGRVENCTVARNTIYGGLGNGLSMSAGQVQNTIVYYNGSASYVRLASDVVQTGGAVSNSCTGVLLAGGGNTANAPLFRDPSGSDYTLLPGSPCLDTATNLASVTIDLNGTGRPIDGDGDGTARPDMGCYEAAAANAGSFRCGFSASVHESIGSLAVTFAPFVAGTDTGITFAGWAFGDGTASNRVDLEPVEHLYAPGTYTVSLTLSNTLGETATAVMTNDIRLAPEATFVATNGAHIVPYDTWAKAATNIQSAIDALISTNAELRTVTVSNGTYGITAEVTIQTPVRVESVNGPEVTLIFRSAGTIRCVRMNHASAFLAGFTITNGSNSGEGAGLYVTAGVVSNCVVSGCTGNRGSAVYLNGVASRLTHSTVRNNVEAGNSGGCGGVRMLSGAVMERCNVMRNRAGSEVSGISGVSMQGNSTSLYCVVVSNLSYSATVASIGLRLQAGDVVRNCLVADNPGRGIHVADGTVENCTVTRNTMYGDVGNGMLQAAGLVRNCIVWANGTDNSKNLSKTGGTFEYSDVNPAETGTGNKSTDPVFLAPASGDFHLDPASPVINAGTNQLWMDTAVDLDGSNRIIATTVDMGCYEAPAAGETLSCNFEAPVTDGLTNLQAVFTASATGSNTNLVYFWWTFGDGQTQEGATKAVVTNLFSVPGYHDVTLVVSNDGGQTAVRTKEDFIYVAPAVAYVSTNGLHTMPFDTWAKAATNIQSAIDAARVQGADSTLVLISNGTYSIGAQVEVLKGITVRSVEGRDATIVRRTAGSQRIVWMNHSNAVLSGLTLTNGAVSGLLLNAGTVRDCAVLGSYGDRSGGAMVMSAGLVSNCIFRASWDTGNSGGCGGVVMSGGRMIGCVITENRGGSSTADIGGLRQTGGEVWHTVISSNKYGTGASGMAGGAGISGIAALRNCLVTANEGIGVAQLGGNVVNCTIVRNSLEGMTQSTGGTTNTIVYFNNGGGADLSGAGTAYSHCCSASLAHDPGGTGNINLDPTFKSPGSGYGTNSVPGDYRTKKWSPCIEGGVFFGWMTDARDLAGDARILNDLPDIGAYESLLPPRGALFLVR